MRSFRIVALLVAVLVACPAPGEAQDRPWIADGTFGYAGFVDDATKHFLVAAGGVRKHVTARLSIGPEFVFMSDGDSVTDRHLMLTGNVAYDAYPPHGQDARRFTPFIVGGLGWFWTRDLVRTGPFWSSEPAFTAGVGVRGRITDRVSAAGEYRLGWELHQRLTGTISIELR
jgi:Outer membrane protein beta-barrel domain